MCELEGSGRNRERGWKKGREREKLIKTETNDVNTFWVRVGVEDGKQEKRIFEKGWWETGRV